MADFEDRDKAPRDLLTKHRSDAAKATLAGLNGCRVPASVVCEALGMDGNTLTNYTRKTELRLLSESSQGKKRLFCLADVYQLALLHSLVGSNHSPKNTAKMLNNLMFEEVVSGALDHTKSYGFVKDERGNSSMFIPVKDSFSVEGVTSKLCADIYKLPELYWFRDFSKPYYIYHNKYVNRLDATQERFQVDNFYGFTVTMCVVTELFAHVDANLSRTLKPITPIARFKFSDHIPSGDNDENGGSDA